eukprot:Selendium_serpulae@DN9470_c0_g1_i1.p1
MFYCCQFYRDDLPRCNAPRALRSTGATQGDDGEVDPWEIKIKTNKRRRLAALVPNSSDVNFRCSVGRGEVCVFEISNAEFNNFNAISFSDTDALVVVVNVRGLFINLAPVTMTNLSNTPIVWNFIDALQITLTNDNNPALVWLD